MTTREVIKEIRQIAKKSGLTFKRSNSVNTINNSPAYVFVVRNSGQIVLSNCTLNSAYDMCCSGFIESWNGSDFDGVNTYI